MARKLKVYPNRPECIIEGCSNGAHMVGRSKKTGEPTWRKYCLSHHNKRRENYRRLVEQGVDIPTCAHGECTNKVTWLGTDENGDPKFPEYCSEHLNIGLAASHGFFGEHAVRDYNAWKNHNIAIEAGFNNYAEYVYDKNLREAKEKGYPSVTAMRNSKHPYRKFRKNYCENIDERLGFPCTYTPPPPELILEAYENGHLKENYYEAWLDVDHKDGNPFNNTEENVQTLCKNCHNWKTLKDGDNLTAGRKTLRKAINNNIIMQEAA